MKIYLYNVDDDYIAYLRTFDSKVCESKKGRRIHTRKYIGAVIEISGCKYFAPLSSPKPKDYNADNTIKRDPIFITRIVVNNEQGDPELKGKIMLGNMIPFNETAFNKYNPNDEKDLRYRTLIIKELDFITKNRKEIVQKANIIYKQKVGIYKTTPRNNYIPHVVDFKLLETKSKLYKKK